MSTDYKKCKDISDVPIALSTPDDAWADKERSGVKSNDYEGRTYVIVESKVRYHKTLGKTLLGIAATVGSLGFGLISKNVRDLFTGREVEKIGLPKEKEASYVQLKKEHKLYSDMTAEKINQLEAAQIENLFPLKSAKVGSNSMQMQANDKIQMQITKKELEALNDDAFVALLPKLSAEYFQIIPDKHLNKLDFKNMKEAQFKALFSSDSRESKRKISLLDETNFKLLLPKFMKMTQIADLIPDNRLNLIDFKKISSPHIQKLFSVKTPGSLQHSIAKAALLTDENFKDLYNKIIDPKNKIINSNVKLKNSYAFTALIPDRLIKKYDYRDCSQDQLRYLFHIDMNLRQIGQIAVSDKSKERFAQLSPQEVINLLNQKPSPLSELMYKNPRLISLFSPEQLKDKNLKDQYDKLVENINRNKPNSDIKPPSQPSGSNPYQVLGIPEKSY